MGDETPDGSIVAPATDSLSASSCADELRSSVREQRRLGARRLELAAHWADLHGPLPVDGDPSDVATVYERRARTRVVQGGSDGTPEVTEFAATELGVLLELTTTSARNLLRDALDLRHRHPRLWAAVQAGRVDDWKARRVVRATAEADLPLESARWVDQETVDAVCGLPFGRAMNVVAAKVMEADPERAESLRQVAGSRRYVSSGRQTEFGMRTLIAQTTSADVARINDMLNILAHLLKEQGDTDDRHVRRAKALGLLANPAMACLLLGGLDLTSAFTQEAVVSAEPAPHAEHPHEPGLPPSQVSDADNLDLLEESRDLDEPAMPEPHGPAHARAAVELAAAVGRALAELGPDVLQRLRPRSVLYFHMAEEALASTSHSDAPDRPPDCTVARAEKTGPLTLPQLREWLATEQVVVRPVIDPMNQTPVDAYEIPDRLREGLTLLHPHEVFPFGTLSSRSADFDHNKPYVPMTDAGASGQTAVANLGPLGRGHHRAKTFGSWTLYQPLPGMYLWATPTGHWFRVDHRGTTPLGRQTPLILRPPRHLSRMEVRFATEVLHLAPAA